MQFSSVNHMGDIVSTVGSSQFGASFFKLFSSILAIDQCTVFAFRGRQPPSPVVLEGKSAQMRLSAHSLANDYVAGAFTHDPNVRLDQEVSSPFVYCLRADEVQDTSYRTRFYDEPCLAHELVVLGQSQDRRYYSSFYRSEPGAGFQPSEIEIVTQFAEFAIKALHRHLELLGEVAAATPSVEDVPSPQKRAALLAHLREVLLADRHMLSPREASVCAGIILGYTTLGISLTFGISVNTVATHRKRAYQKLGICSQNELFSRYFRVVNQHLAETAGGAASVARAQ